MKSICILMSLLISSGLYAQSGSYTLKGWVGNLNAPAKAYLNYRTDTGDEMILSVIKNGIFQFKGKLNMPLRAAVIIDHEGIGLDELSKSKDPDFISIYLEPGTIKLASADSVKKASITGSELNADNQALTIALKPFGERLKILVTEADLVSRKQQTTPEFEADLQKRYDVIQQDQKIVLEEFMQLHPKSLVSIDALRIYNGNSVDAKSEILFNAFSETVKNSQTGKEYAASLNLSKNTSIGAQAAEFIQNDADGKPIALSSFKGKYVLLDFWASWCGPCRQENPAIVRAFNQFKGKNFTILGISLDNKKEAWLKAIENDKLEWTHVSDLKSWKNKVAELYGVKSIPQNFLLDPTGKIIAKNLRGEDLARKLQEIFSESNSN